MKFLNLEAITGEDGSKVLDVSLFGEIDPGFFGDGVASKEIADALTAHADAKEITVRINSVGGDLFGGLAIYNLLRGHGAKVTSIVEGLAASAASIVAMAGRTVMGRGAMMMIHNPMTVTVGDAEDHRQQAEVLDKARDSLLAVYQQKTGKKAGELRKMLDAETWLTAEEAKREGFADEIADKPVKARAEGSTVIVNDVSFARSKMPSPILAMAPAPVAPFVADDPPLSPNALADEPKIYSASDVAKAIAVARQQIEQKEIAVTRDTIAAKAPELLAALLDEGHAKGAAAERARLQAIDELPVRGHAQLLAAAKYGAEPKTAEQVAVAMLKAEGEKGSAFIEARRTESKEAAGVRQSTPEKTTEVTEREAAKTIADLANRRRGGSR